MKISIRVISLLLLFFSCVELNAQTQSSAEPREETKIAPWYVGITGGVTFGISTFSSFGADKTLSLCFRI